MIYVAAWSRVKAYDGKTGELLWSYDPKVPGELGALARNGMGSFAHALDDQGAEQLRSYLIAPAQIAKAAPPTAGPP